MDKKEEVEIAFDIYQPFGPSILKTKLPQLYVDGLNAQADGVLADETVSKERDWSHNLAGNVKKEGIQLVKEKGLFEIHGDEKIMSAMDKLLQSFIASKRMKISADDYQPCYKIIK